MTGETPTPARHRWWKHPVAHFLLIGAALFALNALRQSGGPPADEAAISVDRPRLEALAGIWRAQFGRPPTEAELTTVARSWAQEEMQVREARRMGLDRDDSVIRRRLAQKYEFLVNNPASLAPPSDDTLRRYLAQHSDRYAGPSRYSFAQVYFSADRGREKAFKAAEAAMRDPASARGDAFPGNASERNATEQEIRQDYGANFVAALPRLRPGVWEGPVESGFGFHLVKVTARKALAPPEFAAVRGQVLADWLADTAEAAAARAADDLAKRYRVSLDAAAIRQVAGDHR
jgi:peptidyl-prolyl cis-trans isomerase C